ncbi:MAG: FtsH protease activity modulator HflK [Candidatus Riflebacteria bacterium]|nr:FtsH protease activity modulator HflK [Candidatus Riflebacteria bacterium]MBR4329358.1 FtsH protease activity modulator HflK [Candidatus Riflebacteria bacterium]
MKKIDYGKNIDNSSGNQSLSITEYKPVIIVVIVAVIGIFLLSGISSLYYTVEPEEKAIVLRLGKVNSVETSGLHFKMPFGIDKIIKIKTERVFKEEFGFKTTSSKGGRTTYDNSSRLDESLMLTGDLNVCEIEWIVQYKVDDPIKYLFSIKDPVSSIRDVSEAVTRKIIGNENVTDVLTTKRDSLQKIIQTELQKTIKRYDIGVSIDLYKFQNVKPPKTVEASFNSVNKAKQDQKTMLEKAQKEYNDIIPSASGESNRAIKEAEGYAMKRVNEAQGEANRFLSLLNEYHKYPELTRTRLYLETMEKIYPRMKDIIIVDGESSKSGVTPLLPLQGFDGGDKQ